jgi:hypothetical protein
MSTLKRFGMLFAAFCFAAGLMVGCAPTEEGGEAETPTDQQEAPADDGADAKAGDMEGEADADAADTAE